MTTSLIFSLVVIYFKFIFIDFDGLFRLTSYLLSNDFSFFWREFVIFFCFLNLKLAVKLILNVKNWLKSRPKQNWLELLWRCATYSRLLLAILLQPFTGYLYRFSSQYKELLTRITDSTFSKDLSCARPGLVKCSYFSVARVNLSDFAEHFIILMVRFRQERKQGTVSGTVMYL